MIVLKATDPRQAPDATTRAVELAAAVPLRVTVASSKLVFLELAGRDAPCSSTTAQSSPVSNDPGSSTLRQPLRLQLSESPGRAALDGGWWPQSRDIDIELADLVDRFPPPFGRVHRVLYSRPDWETQPRSVRVARGMLKTGSFPRDDTHLMILSMSTHTRLHLLVVPPAEPMGQQAMTISADPWNRLPAAEILASVALEADAAEGDGIWTDDGCNWWGGDAEPPSFRRGS